MTLRACILLGLIGCAPDISVIKQKVDADNDGYLEDVDCDDAHATVNPDAPEKCDGLDNDCDGVVDDDANDATTWYTDGDGDAFGDIVNVTCDVPPDAALVGGDCDDLDPAVNPDEDEVCDGVDQDCDGDIDEDATDAEAWYDDADGDGFGDGPATLACEAAAGQVPDDGDCDDSDNAIHPGAPEVDCADPTDYNCDGSVGYADADHDGIAACEECDDADPASYPGAPEVCDGADNDCDSRVDEDVTTPFYADSDGDGYGDAGDTTDACAAPAGYVSDDSDCDDGRSDTWPGAVETCDDTDQDCDGTVDENAVDAGAWYPDADGDGYGAGAATVTCDAPAGAVSNASDCDDAASGVHPGATETCDDMDEDCDSAVDDGAIDATTWYADADTDRYGDVSRSITACDQPAGYVTNATDCDDVRADTHPGGTEVCDRVDQDCDGTADDDAADADIWYADADRDTYGDAATTVYACSAPGGYVADDTDCDDGAARVYPGAPEYCDGIDHDCDGAVDESSSVDASTWYRDADSDSYGLATSSVVACDAPTGYVAVSTDCNDSLASVNPGETEVCDPADIDEDCSGPADDADPGAAGKSTWYLDSDSDSYGGTRTTTSCDQPAGYVSRGSDCNDGSAAINPSASEACDAANTDEDCDSLADDADSAATGKTVWYEDADGDAYGSPTSFTRACDDPGGYTSDNDDCDDANASINPGETERCDAADTDEDCDGDADDHDTSASGKTTWYLDDDGDGFAGGSTTLACDLPAYAFSTNDDCDDTDTTAYPGAAETCGDSIDQDCDGADDACPPPWSGDSIVSAGYETRTYGAAASDRFGQSMRGGDFNGDGLGDLLVGDTSYTVGGKDGAVFGYYGDIASGDGYNTDDDDLLVYNTYSSYSGSFGSRLWNLGDLDGDDADDWVVDVGSNTTLMMLGGDTGTNTYASVYDVLAYCTAATGVGDMYVASATLDWACGYSAYSSQRGVVYLYGGVTASPVLATRTGETSGDLAGYSAAGGEDVDGDGYPDLLVGAYRNDGGGTDAGAIYLEYGAMSGTATLATADVKITGPAASAELGMTVYMPGDLDGDGYADLVAGAPGVSGSATTSGALYVFTTPTSGSASSVAAATYYGEDAGDGIGTSHDTIDFGDFDGDGRADLVAGVSTNDDNGGNAGGVYVVYAPYSGTVTLPDPGGASWIGEEVNDLLGSSVAAIPDMDGDGRDELAMGARGGDNAAGSDAGSVYIWRP